MSDIKEIASALVLAQLEMQNPVFDAKNPHFKNQYASLAAVRNAIVPVLAKHGIAFIQNLTTAEGTVSCETVLIHKSGQMLSYGPLTLPVTKMDAQGYASSITYARRISAMAAMNIVGDHDDDGEAAVGRTVTYINADQQAVIEKLLTETKSNKTAFLKYLGVASVNQLPANQYNDAVSALEKKVQK
jgi:hypothetical protein